MSLWDSIAAFFRGGASSRHAKKFKDQLEIASKNASRKLGYVDTCRYVDVRVVPGTIYRGGERWGAIEPRSRREAGGWCERRGAGIYHLFIVSDPKTMKPSQARLNHEYGHAILFEHGEPQDKHEDILKSVGI
jgi:hypothetical protein